LPYLRNLVNKNVVIQKKTPFIIWHNNCETIDTARAGFTPSCADKNYNSIDHFVLKRCRSFGEHRIEYLEVDMHIFLCYSFRYRKFKKF
jgi:hypothetical protein